MPTIHAHENVWAHDFDNSARHCFRSTLTGQYEQQGYPHGVCLDWRDHQKSTGMTEWLRFIRRLADQIIKPSPFTSGRILFEYDGHPTSDGRLTYAETYLHVTDDKIKVAFRVFLDNDSADRWARIECYDPELFDACNMALASVRQSYVDELEAAMVPS